MESISKNMELVSIVIPVYNMGFSLEDCVQSLMKQDYEKLEIILVDDGSKDDSFERCRKLSEADERIHVYHTDNQGSGPARNFGISKANGRYIYFPDADDYLVPNGISVMVQAMQSGNCDLVVFGFKNVNQDGNTVFIQQYEESIQDADTIRQNYSDYFTMYSKYGIQGAPWNKFFDLDVIHTHHIEYPPLRRHQDEGFIARYMCFAEKVHFIEPVLYTYFINDQQKEWLKYPVTYIDSVIGLFEERKKNILAWNPQDEKTHYYVYREYARGVLRAIQLSFAPKMNLKGKERKKWIADVLQRTQITHLPIQNMGTRYQNLLFSLIRKNRLSTLYAVLKVQSMRRSLLNK